MGSSILESDPVVSRLTADFAIRRPGFQLHVQLEVGAEIVVLFGPSGSGKTTTLNALAGLVTPDRGQITLDAQTLFRDSTVAPGINVPTHRRRVGYVFQHYALLPHLTAHEEVEVSALVALRRDLKAALAERGVALSYLPFVIRAVALSLKDYPKLNCRLDLENNRVIYQRFCNVGIAVDTPDGLIVPVIHDADRLSIVELAEIIADFAVRARERKLTLDEIRGGTFSVTNYGSLAGTFGTPIINYPEVAILGVGRILEKPVVRNGQIVPGHVLPLSLSADHRIVDGGDVARFLLDLMKRLATPVTLLLE